MARWKLMVPHYLNVRDEKWEYKEIDQTTGREKRMQINVPRHLDPTDPQCWTSRWGNRDNQQGEIIVCHEGKGEPSDVVFFGDPTPDMMPMDDEARELTASFEKVWAYKPETDAVNYSQSMIDKMSAEMKDIKSQAPAGMEDLVKQIAALTSAITPIAVAAATPQETVRRV